MSPSEATDGALRLLCGSVQSSPQGPLIRGRRRSGRCRLARSHPRRARWTMNSAAEPAPAAARRTARWNVNDGNGDGRDGRDGTPRRLRRGRRICARLVGLPALPARAGPSRSPRRSGWRESGGRSNAPTSAVDLRQHAQATTCEYAACQSSQPDQKPSPKVKVRAELAYLPRPNFLFSENSGE